MRTNGPRSASDITRNGLAIWRFCLEQARMGPVTRVAWFHCFAGIAGDMALGALVDAGASLDEIGSLVRRLPVGGWALRAEPVMRAGLAATHVRVVVEDETTVVRTYSHITGLIEEARLPHRVRDRALATFAALAEAEAQVHRRPIAQVHFHEVGGIDAIVDIVGTCAALEILGVDEVASSPVAQGIGMIRGDHGPMPNPAPAVIAVLARAHVPTYGRDLPVELTTPTGAALLAAMSTSYGPIPPMTPGAVGYGAGTRDMDGLPNLVQVVIGERRAQSRPTQPMAVIEANVDDVTGEVLAHAISRLIESGAADAWVTPIVMKKGRPAYTVSVLCDDSLMEQLSRVLAEETGTLGVRGHRVDRWAAARTIHEVDIEGYPVRVKVGPGRTKAEFDDASKVAQRTGVPLREVLSRAEAAWRRAQEQRAQHPSGQEDRSFGTEPVPPIQQSPLSRIHDTAHDHDHGQPHDNQSPDEPGPKLA